MRTFLLLILLSISIHSFSQNKTVEIDRIGIVYPNPNSDETYAIIIPQKVIILDSVDNFIKVEFLNKESKQKDIGWINTDLIVPTNMDDVIGTANEIISETYESKEIDSYEEIKVSFKTAFINSIKITLLPALIFIVFISVFLSNFNDKRYKKGYKNDSEKGARPYRKKIWFLIFLGLVAAIPLSLIFYIFNINFDIF